MALGRRRRRAEVGGAASDAADDLVERCPADYKLEGWADGMPRLDG